jgi:two-component system KDP operon response regulator KdpE
MAKHLILVVDDDVPILRLVRAKLQADGYSVMTAGNGEDALSALEEERPDLVVLDLMMPGMDGFETMRRIREDSTIPIILLTARTGASDKIQGLDLGADDYVTKPFNPDELSSRIAAILRRTTGGTQPKNQVLRYDQLTINLEKRRVTIEDQEVHLSRTEWELLHQLASHTGRVMLHAELLTRIWGPEFRDETHYLRTWVSRLRKKLGDDQEPPTLITTFPGMGYRLEPPEETG